MPISAVRALLLLSIALALAVPTSPLQAQQGGTGGARPSKRRPAGVRGMFDAAQELFDAGKYPEALAAYSAILRKYPGHEPAAIQLAKTLYRMDRIKDAYGLFARLNPQHLDPETSYEYGWSFYQSKGWEGALAGFQRVPKGHALYDLANYYGGICAIKLKRYDDAEDMLEKAVVLPDKLAKSRTLYIKHVQALRLMQQKNSLAKERSQAKEDLADANKKKAKKDDKDAKPPADQPYAHQGFKQITKAATLKYTDSHEYIDNNGLKSTTYDAKVSNIDLQSGPIIPLPFKNGKDIATGKDRQAAIGLQLTLDGEDRVTRGQEQRILADESADDLTRELNRGLGESDVKTGKVDADLWTEIPLPENVWLAAGAELNFQYPDLVRYERAGYRRGYLDLNGKVSATGSYGGELTYYEILNPSTRPVTTITEGSATMEAELMAKLTVDAKVAYDLYAYPDIDGATVDGPDSAETLELRATEAAPLGFKLALLGAAQSEQNYVIHGLPSFAAVSADAMVYTGKATLSLTPPILPWLTISIAELLQKTQWKLSTKAAADSFAVNTPDYIEKFDGKVSVNLAF